MASISMVSKEPLIPNKPNEKRQTHSTGIAKSKKLFDKWRFYHLMYSSLGTLAIIPALIDYERRYPIERDAQDCSANSDVSPAYRWVCLVMSFLAIGFIFPYRIFYLHWRKQLPETYAELPALRKVTLFEILRMKQKITWRKIFDGETIYAIVLFLILPYPGLSLEMHIPEQNSFKNINVCYYLSELLYAVMYSRILFLVLSFFNFGKFQNQIAMRHCEKFGINTSAVFSLKCYMKERPLQMVFLFFLVPSVVVIGLVLRVMERPMVKEDGLDFNYAGNDFWLVIITMTTVGYGDLYPETTLGRLIIVFAALWGGVVLAIVFASMGSFLEFSNKEQGAYDSITVSKAAGDAITTAFKFHKETAGMHSNKMKSWGRVLSKVENFRQLKGYEGPSNDQVEKRLSDLESSVEEVKGKLDLILEKLNN